MKTFAILAQDATPQSKNVNFSLLGDLAALREFFLRVFMAWILNAVASYFPTAKDRPNRVNLRRLIRQRPNRDLDLSQKGVPDVLYPA